MWFRLQLTDIVQKNFRKKKKWKIVPQFFDGTFWKVMIRIGLILFLHADIFEILFAWFLQFCPTSQFCNIWKKLLKPQNLIYLYCLFYRIHLILALYSQPLLLSSNFLYLISTKKCISLIMLGGNLCFNWKGWDAGFK